MIYTPIENSKQYVSGIYCIESECGKKYIGSAIKLKMRYGVHVNQIKNQRHDNPRIQNFVNKYGVDKLTFYTLELCEKDKLIEREQYYIDTINPFFNVLRIAGNTAGNKPWLGRKHSDETKAKISATNIATKSLSLKPKKVRPSRDENIAKLIVLSRTPESRKRNSEVHKGNTYWLGKKHKPETIAARCGAGNGRARAVRCIELNMTFGTGREACKHFGLSRSAVGNAIRKHTKVFGKYTMQYADN